MICLTHIRMRHAWKVQGRSVSDLPWKSWTFPYAAWWGLCWCFILVIAEFYLSVWPMNYSHNSTTRATSFFSTYVSIVAIVVIYICAKIWFRGPFWHDSSKIDLDAGRRFYTDEQVEESKGGKSAWKRFAETIAH